MAWVRETIAIPDDLKPAERILLAHDVIEFIKDRTLGGLDKNNKPFKKYTKAYADKKGVDESDVDLFVEGDLFDEMTILNHKKGSITIGYEKGAEINGKAEGNITGSYGREPNKKKARDFLGIAKGDLVDIVESIR